MYINEFSTFLKFPIDNRKIVCYCCVRKEKTEKTKKGYREMIANSEMTYNRYGQWAKARTLYNRIQTTLSADGIVTIATHTQAIHYYKKHIDMFKMTHKGVFVQHGKRWDCIDYCAIVFYTHK